MRHKGLLIGAIVLILLGIAGLVVLGFSAGSLRSFTSDYSSDGERIYYTGLRENGRPIPRSLGRGAPTGFGMMNRGGCVTCHTEDGRGGAISMMMWQVEVPDIRYRTLTSRHSEDGTETPGWTDAEIARAIREGIEPSGDRLKPPMPRWRMTDREVGDVIAYLKELR